MRKNLAVSERRSLPCLSLSNRGKKDGKWNVEIKNPMSHGIIVYYNEKMCFENDACNWTGLSDIASLVLPADGSAVVRIPQNGLATCVAFSYIVNGYRVVSYAGGLNGRREMSVMNNIVKV